MEPPIPVSLSLMLRSFIHTLNSRGDKMPPWRTPLVPVERGGGSERGLRIKAEEANNRGRRRVGGKQIKEG